MHVKGLDFKCRPKPAYDATIVRQVVKHNLYQIPVQLTGWKVLDIGAHIGAMTLLAAQRGAQVWAFEPARESYCLLCQNIKRNRLNVQAFNFGVGLAGIHKLYQHPTNNGMHSSFSDLYTDLSDTYEWMWTVSLAQVFALTGVERFDFLKLDCEGCEREIIPEIVDQFFPRIERIGIELHGSEEWKRDALGQLAERYLITALTHDEFRLDAKG